MSSSPINKAIPLRKLPPKGVIAVTAPASPPDADRLKQGVKYLKNLGYRVEVGKTCYQHDRYLAGSASIRANEFMKFIDDPKIDAIFCARGGFGSMQLLNLLDYERIKTSRKLFIGFSDITVMQWAIYAKTGLPTVSAGMVATDMAHLDINHDFESHFWELLQKGSITYDLPGNANIKEDITGISLVGTISVAAKSLGSHFFPDTTNTILVLEDVLEPKHKVDGYLGQFLLANIFEQCKAVILGTFTPALAEEYPDVPEFDEIFDRIFHTVKVPVVRNFAYGHIRNKISLPVGVPLCLSSGSNLQLKTLGSIFES